MPVMAISALKERLASLSTTGPLANAVQASLEILSSEDADVSLLKLKIDLIRVDRSVD